jgi:hypothetical protein
MTKIPLRDAFHLMQACLRRVLPVMIVRARTARTWTGKEQARQLVNEIHEALQAAEDAE